MNFGLLKNNLVSVIKESQIKLGYESISFGVNYVTPSLLHLLKGASEEDLYQTLIDFCTEYEGVFGNIEVVKNDTGYRLNVPAKGVDYVYSTYDDGDFLVKFINEIRNPLATVASVVDVFRSFGSEVHIEKIENGEFDYLIYFENGEPDDFLYCIDVEDLGMTYHRFMKDDYLDFEF